MIIYCITNGINGKKYIGQTIQKFSKRWRRHLCSGHALYLAIQKYGKENFSFEILEETDNIEKLNDLEKKWIAELNTISPNGYNLTSGGGAFSVSEESKKKMSLAHLGKKLSDYQKRNMSEAQKLCQVRPDVVAAKQNRMIGNKYTLGISPKNKGVPCSKETKKKISEKLSGRAGTWSGRRHSEESKTKISEHNWIKAHPEFHPMLGKHHSEDALLKMRIAAKNRDKPSRAVPVIVEGIRFNTKKEACSYFKWSYSKLQRYLSKRTLI